MIRLPPSVMKRFIDCVIPFRTCNLRCEYCYITHTKSWGAKLPVFPYGADHIGRALSAERLGGISLINLCGEGETLLPPEVVGIVRAILKQGHYVMVVTNGTVSKRFDEIVTLPREYLDRLLIKFSYHYLELKKRNWLDVFFGNVQRVRQAGGSVSVELTPSDEMIPHINDAVAICRARVGAVCHVTVARDERNPNLSVLTGRRMEEYRDIWSGFDSQLFRFKLSVFGEKRREYCYAGLWSGTLDLVSGELRQCYHAARIQNIFEDVGSPIRFSPVGFHCPEPHCFNAHAFMTLGVIPSFRAPHYADMRNRVCDDGSEWLKPNMKAFLSRKLDAANRGAIWAQKAQAVPRRVLRLGRRVARFFLARMTRRAPQT